MTFVGRVPLSIAYYRASGNVPVYVVSAAFQLAELIP